MDYVWWLAAALFLGIIEILSLDFFFLMLAIGALIAAIPAAVGLGFSWQVAIFCMSSLLFLFLVRPWAKRHLVRSVPNVATNVYALVGYKALTLTEVTAEEGQVKIGGEVWSAKSGNGQVIPQGKHVIVHEIQGATAVVIAEINAGEHS